MQGEKIKCYLIIILLLGISLFISSRALAVAPTVSSVTIDYNDGVTNELIITWSVAVAGTNDASVLSGFTKPIKTKV